MRVIGTLRAYKQEKQFIGGKVVEATDKSVFCHYFEIIHCWMYLTKELERLNENLLGSVNDSARNIALGGGMSYNNGNGNNGGYNTNYNSGNYNNGNNRY